MAESRLVTPKLLFRRVAVAEAITWALLLIGMFLKYVTETTDLGVRIFGMVHGVVFLAYGLIAITTWVNQRWQLGVGMLALVSAVPPFATILFDRRVEAAGLLEGPWRFGAGGETPSTLPERVLAGDVTARRALVDVVHTPLVAAGRDLVDTLQAYLDTGGALEATARLLFVHANTVRYRLNRVEQVTGLLATDPRERWTLQLGLAVGRLAESPRTHRG